VTHENRIAIKIWIAPMTGVCVALSPSIMPQIFSRDRLCPPLCLISHLPIHVFDCNFAY
jgi:hypothetical protein